MRRRHDREIWANGEYGGAGNDGDEAREKGREGTCHQLREALGPMNKLGIFLLSILGSYGKTR